MEFITGSLTLTIHLRVLRDILLQFSLHYKLQVEANKRVS